MYFENGSLGNLKTDTFYELIDVLFCMLLNGFKMAMNLTTLSNKLIYIIQGDIDSTRVNAYLGINLKFCIISIS